jgi:eukaryotic-like serine/threonine-protein kinase
MPEIGDLIEGKYRLLRKIGEGGMATVWEAEHVRLEKRVAVKLIAASHPAIGSDRERFLEEARAAAQVRHRNVIDIMDYGTTDDGMPFMVMELLPGDTLADLIDRDAPMPLRVTVELATQILGALAAVHEHGIVHRDLKPENVLFARDSDGSFAKIVDFGISKTLDAEQNVRRPKTREGLLLGTPQYMSPEQARGLASVDHRTDIYAMGVILYEMLSGFRPFEGETVTDVLLSVIEGDPAPLESLRTDLPREVIEVVERAMAYQLEDRWEHAREMRSALALAAKAPAPPEPEEAPPPPVRGDANTAAIDTPVIEARDIPPARPRSGFGSGARWAKPPSRAVTGARGKSAFDSASESESDSASESESDSVPQREPSRPKSVELPDPRPMPLPSPERGRIVRTLAVIAILGALAAAPELFAPGFYRNAIAGGREWAGIDPRAASAIDAGLPRGDAGFITARLEGVPPGATILLDRREISPPTVDTLRTDRDTVDLPVPTRRGPFEVGVRLEGAGEWRARRWTTQDFTFQVRLRSRR